MSNSNDFQKLITQVLSLYNRQNGRAFSSPEPLSGTIYSKDEEILLDIAKLFFVLLSGNGHPQYDLAHRKLHIYKKQKKWAVLLQFLSRGLKEIPREINRYSRRNSSFKQAITEVVKHNENDESELFLSALRKVFFPEGLGMDEPQKRKAKTAQLRRKRTVTVERLNDKPIANAAREMLFTSNILLTVPLDDDSQKWRLSERLKSPLQKVRTEKQKYWYDHPVPVGIEAEKNEILYGLRGLQKMMEFEVEKKHIPADSRLNVLLSVSTTHDGLHTLVKDYFNDLLNKAKDLSRLRLFVFSEQDTEKILDTILIPLAKYYFPDRDREHLQTVFGVDGEYGRHYSFLKAIAALWQVFVNPQIKATFKIDLDQVFPQQEMIEQSGESALQHFCTPLWGARGKDEQGRDVDLSMIAGALVNHNDIEKSLFYPDIVFPPGKKLSADELIFHSALPQALSTEAEMMTRYADGPLDGKNRVLQRIHVTGGTNGILIEALRKRRPFTPSIIGRAEDQAYLLSVLFDQNLALRYLHKPGLIMRHDKHIFAGEAIEAAALGKRIGDYVRILLFSYYGKALPWPVEKIKEVIDPFTGCFMSRIPLTVVYLRFVFEILAKIQQGEQKQALEFAQSGARRLNKVLDWLLGGKNPLQDVYHREKAGWDLYYDVLDITEEKLRQGDGFAEQIRARLKEIMNDCFLDTD